MSPITVHADMAHPPPGPQPPPDQPPGPWDPPDLPPPQKQHYGPSSLFPGMTSLWPAETCAHGFHGAMTA